MQLGSTNTWNAGSATSDYYSAYTYDANGNITNLKRRADSSIFMDDLTYHYQSGTNKLLYVDDGVAAGLYGNDIDDQSSGNYAYDEIGNLIQDLSEEIANIEWTVYGKIKTITRTSGSTKPSLGFDYSPDGHRIAKHVTDSNGYTSTTWYIRDASGNVMATYNKGYEFYLDTSQLDLVELYDAVKEDYPHNSTLAFLHDGLNWYDHIDTSGNFGTLHTDITNNSLEEDFLDYFSTIDFLTGALFDSVYARVSASQISDYLRSYGYTDGDLVDAVCAQCIDSLLATMMRNNYASFLLQLHGTNVTAFDDLCAQLSVPAMMPLNDKITMIMALSNESNTAGLLSGGGLLTCSDILTIFDNMFVLGSSLGQNELNNVPGLKACYKSSLGETELASAMENTLGFSGMWDRIFIEDPGTENSYVHSIRQNEPALFLYHGLLALGDYTYLDNFAYGISGISIGEWLDAIKNHFGEGYYNSYIAKLLPNNYTSNWVFNLNEQHIYGSSRIGYIERNKPLIRQRIGGGEWNWVTENGDTAYVYDSRSDSIQYQRRGAKRYELSNHLGNVLAVITDRRIQACETGELMHYEAQIVQVMDYYSFGSLIEKRSWNASKAYRYGFNGMERDDNVKGEGNSLDFGARIYESRLGRFLSVDPLWIKAPSITPYRFSMNSPLWLHDPDGKFEIKGSTEGKNKGQRQQNRQEKRALRQLVREAKKEMKSWDEDDWDFIESNTGLNPKEYKEMFKNGRGPELKFTNSAVRSSGLMNGDDEGNLSMNDRYAQTNGKEIVLDEAFYHLYSSIKKSKQKSRGVGKLHHPYKRLGPSVAGEEEYIAREENHYLSFGVLVLGHEAQHVGAAMSGLPAEMECPYYGTIERGEAYEIHFTSSVKNHADYGYSTFRAFEERKYLPGQYLRDSDYQDTLDDFWNEQYAK